MSRATLFPGQGSQYVGMGKEIAENFAVAKEVFQEIDDTLNQNLSKLMFEGPLDTLTLTENTQPALMAVSIAALRVITKEGGIPFSKLCNYTAGHSLGEYTALAAAGSLSVPDAARLLRIRGKAMQEAVPPGKGGMAALLGSDMEAAKAIAKQAAEGDICDVANDNAPGQVVISGSMAAIDRAVAIAAESGKRAMKLSVSAPFHSKLMSPAAKVMKEALEAVTVNPPSVPLIANVTAKEVQSPDEIRALLVEQVAGMVRWRESMLYLKELGVTHMVEIGAGKVLSGLMKRIDKDVETLSLQTPQDIEAFLKGF